MLHFSLTSLSTSFQSYNDSQLLYNSDSGRLLWNGFAVLSDMQIIIFKFRVCNFVFCKKNGPAHNIFDTYQIFELPILSRTSDCAQHSQSPRCSHTQRTVKKKAQAKLRRLAPLCSWPCILVGDFTHMRKLPNFHAFARYHLPLNATNLCKRTTKTLHKKMTAY